MYEIIQDFNHEIFEEKEGPFISIYQNTHKTPDAVRQDEIKFKNLLKKITSSLKETYDEETIESVLKPLQELKENKSFWNTNTDAFALLATTKNVVVFRLNKPVKEKAIVADSFHTKPLIRHFQTKGTFDVLTLDRENFALYTCNQDHCQKVHFDEDVAITKTEVLGTLDEEDYLSHASYNGAGNQAMFHGHDDNKNVIEKDTRRYFKYIDNFINDQYSKPNNQPLVLWALPEHQGVFRKLSNNKHLLDEGIKHSDKDLKENKVHEEAWRIVKPIYLKEIDNLVKRYKQAHAKGQGSDDIQKIGKMILQKNIDSALIASQKTIPGKFNQTDGSITSGEIDHPLYDDVLDDLAEKIIEQGGKVVVLDDEDMPTTSGIAAIFRY